MYIFLIKLSAERKVMKIKFVFNFFFLILVFCGNQPENQVNFSNLQKPGINKKTVIKFGVVARYSPRLIYQGYQPIMDYLTEETDYCFELKLSKTYSEALNFLKTDSVQIASLGTCSYIEANKTFGAHCILKPLNSEGKPFFKGIIIVRDDSPIKTLKDLKGKKFVFASKKATAGFLIPKKAMYQSGVYLKDLSGYVNIEHHNSVVRAVLRGEYDAGAVKDIIAYKNKEKGLRFIYTSDNIPSVPIAIGATSDKAMVNQVKEALLKLDPNNPDQKELMKTWDAEFRHGFVEAKDADYDPIRELIEWLAVQEKL